MNLTEVIDLFDRKGCENFHSEFIWEKKTQQIKAYLFDWDGVFHSGSKGPSYPGTFSEEDSMGINMLRFSHFLRTGEFPFVGIISGEDNPTASFFAKRECLDGVFLKVKNKVAILDYLKEFKGIEKNEICFVFDDILDLSLAKEVGIRIKIRRNSSPLFASYCDKHKLVDFRTSLSGNEGGTRQFCEFYLGITNMFETTIEKRIDYHEDYQNFMKLRSQIMPGFFRFDEGRFLKISQ